MGIKGISLSDLDETQRGPLWVINTAAQSKWELLGDVLVTVPNGNGRNPDKLQVKQTWLPVDVAQLIPRERLLASTEFRSAVIEGLITVIDRSDAERLLRQEGAHEERLRMTQMEQHVRKQGSARSILDSKVEITRTDGVTDDDDSPVEIFGGEDMVSENLAHATKAGIEVDDDGLMPSFKMFANKLAHESDINALNAIKARGKFSRRELKYLARTLEKHPKTLVQVQARIQRSLEKGKKKKAA